jgi:hypothetical protein
MAGYCLDGRRMWQKMAANEHTHKILTEHLKNNVLVTTVICK